MDAAPDAGWREIGRGAGGPIRRAGRDRIGVTRHESRELPFPC